MKIILSISLLFILFTAPARALEFSDIANEGQIKFLKERPDPGAYNYSSRVMITESSLSSGIVTVSTCHYQLDPIRKVVIVFNEKRVRKILIKSLEMMSAAEVKGNYVTLVDVERGASICIDIESKALDRLSDNQFKLNAGPLMRRYFDGYLPMAATLRVDWPKDLMMVEKTNPVSQDGVKIFQASDGVQLEMVFAGKLTAQVFLKKP